MSMNKNDGTGDFPSAHEAAQPAHAVTMSKVQPSNKKP